MLFDREEQDFGTDVATRALSVTAVENDFVNRVYEKLAKVYDLIFGPTLHHGRLVAIERVAMRPSDRVLEVGVGTGINLNLYPRNCHVTGIDLSTSMPEKPRNPFRKPGCGHGGRRGWVAGHSSSAAATFAIASPPTRSTFCP